MISLFKKLTSTYKYRHLATAIVKKDAAQVKKLMQNFDALAYFNHAKISFLGLALLEGEPEIIKAVMPSYLQYTKKDDPTSNEIQQKLDYIDMTIKPVELLFTSDESRCATIENLLSTGLFQSLPIAQQHTIMQKFLVDARIEREVDLDLFQAKIQLIDQYLTPHLVRQELLANTLPVCYILEKTKKIQALQDLGFTIQPRDVAHFLRSFELYYGYEINDHPPSLCGKGIISFINDLNNAQWLMEFRDGMKKNEFISLCRTHEPQIIAQIDQTLEARLILLEKNSLAHEIFIDHSALAKPKQTLKI